MFFLKCFIWNILLSKFWQSNELNGRHAACTSCETEGGTVALAAKVVIGLRVLLVFNRSLSHTQFDLSLEPLFMMSFPGATAYFTESEGVSLEAVEDDHTEKIESLEASFEVDDQQSTGQLRLAVHLDESTTSETAAATSSDPGPSIMAAPASHDMDYNLKKALEHVIMSSTLSNYERY